MRETNLVPPETLITLEAWINRCPVLVQGLDWTMEGAELVRAALRTAGLEMKGEPVNQTPMTQSEFDWFVMEVRDICEAAAKDKGYNTTGVDGKNDLYQFIQSITGSDAHAIGEIIYKAVRYSRRRDRKDLIKIAAWAYLIYKFGPTGFGQAAAE